MAGSGYSICIPTYRRPLSLGSLLSCFQVQHFSQDLSLIEVIVSDNDAEESAKPVVEAFRAKVKFPVVYSMSPVPNVSSNRNNAMSLAKFENIILLDDDQQVSPYFLRVVHQYLADLIEKHGSAVSGIVFRKDHVFAEKCPENWTKSTAYQLRNYPDSLGAYQFWSTNGVLLRRSMFLTLDQPFDLDWGDLRCEDNVFFLACYLGGHKFQYTNSVVVNEVIAAERCTWAYFLKRRYTDASLYAYIHRVYMDKPTFYLLIAKSLAVLTLLIPVFLVLLIIPWQFFHRWRVTIFGLLSRQVGKLRGSVGPLPPSLRNKSIQNLNLKRSLIS